SATTSPPSPLDSSSDSTGARTSAAAPSSEGIGPCGDAPTTPAMRSPASAAAATPEGPKAPPSSLLTTSTAGTDPESGKSCWIRLTSAASESSGRVVGDSEEDPDDARANTAPVRSRTTSSVSQAETLPVNACLTGRYPLCSERKDRKST